MKTVRELGKFIESEGGVGYENNVTERWLPAARGLLQTVDDVSGSPELAVVNGETHVTKAVPLHAAYLIDRGILPIANQLSGADSEMARVSIMLLTLAQEVGVDPMRAVIPQDSPRSAKNPFYSPYREIVSSWWQDVPMRGETYIDDIQSLQGRLGHFAGKRLVVVDALSLEDAEAETRVVLDETGLILKRTRVQTGMEEDSPAYEIYTPRDHTAHVERRPFRVETLPSDTYRVAANNALKSLRDAPDYLLGLKHRK